MNPSPNRLLAKVKASVIAMVLFLASILSACSTLPATSPLVLPPPGAMEKAQPLPKLKQDATVSDLIDNDLEVVDLYHELSKRHGKLVDYVQSLMNKQVEQ